MRTTWPSAKLARRWARRRADGRAGVSERGGGCRGLHAGRGHHSRERARVAAPAQAPRIRGPAHPKRLASGPVALLFGSEKFGLSNEDLSPLPLAGAHPHAGRARFDEPGPGRCRVPVRVGARTTRRSVQAREAPAGDGEVARPLGVADRSAGSERLRERHVEASTEVKVRRLVRRLGLPARDTEVWLGILSQILWRLDAGRAT